MNIVVLLGGHSQEREISLASGSQVKQALIRLGHEVTCLDLAEIDPHTWPVPAETLLFLAVHGRFGEDGQLQNILESRQLPFTGSNAHASQLAFHKSLAKQVFERYHIPTPPWQLLEFDDSHSRHPDNLISSQENVPLVVKPDSQGSSIGVTIVRRVEELESALNIARQFDHKILIEDCIDGQEWTIAVFERMAFPPIMIKPASGFYNYQAKYQDKNTEYQVHTQETSFLKSLKTLATDTCEALGTSGLARVDLIIDSHNQPWVLEVNTIPGMTSISTAPQAAEAAGWSYDCLCQKICEQAMDLPMTAH